MEEIQNNSLLFYLHNISYNFQYNLSLSYPGLSTKKTQTCLSMTSITTITLPHLQQRLKRKQQAAQALLVSEAEVAL